ncbi:hypothetical protein LTR91_001060 [Friedmanniomyces endolithicus]|uniref:ABC transporter ATPase n=1 Tax=Friedmanniomyces endolithicus TaxID=329885 RepID=A0AAN6FF74_9PEZI|nr:hypothetical protein LTR82_012981 [Friedmanniomyces endolithicus]KAK0920199.1 hypothetical protein LTR57_010063 [Friedmanniomyces endolithicus]KAK0973240.1 hypothetical protein LTR54_017396 [Friedmanniomyces endolithicus]KAK1011443.1 hypothetical protein LTS01_001299 [Friedmanniomyces endolithicus]KAK1014197.1 hypothetical protein LTR91_001060 [Friedmanniomyces endolithicus]
MSGRGSRGRGAYYRAKYGGGGRRGASQDGGGTFDRAAKASVSYGIWDRLQDDLRSIDGQQYGAYKRLLGKYEHSSPTFTLSVDHVQGDAYASPSRVRAVIPWQETGLPDEYLQSDIRRIALCDFVTRICAAMIRAKHLDQNVSGGGGWSGPKGGAFNINSPGQEILPRTSAMIDGNDTIELRFTVSLPAAGRTVLGQQAYQILGVNLVELVKKSLFYPNLDQEQLQLHVQTAENQQSLRHQLAEHNLTAFIADGSVLPRASGASETPMDSANVVPFKSPKDLKVELLRADGTNVSGMGVPRGVTLLTGGGFHGKSTVLEAIQLGVYNHVPGDGRELVVTDPTAVKIRAEDGRSVTSVDISPFISNLPGGKDTHHFTTNDASGSTSMAANIQEALEAGCKTLLIDEDSSATNLLVRDQRMQSLIHNEPITPLVAKARALYECHGVSTIIVIGGLGDWLSVADLVIGLDSYVPRVLTKEAKSVVEKYPSNVQATLDYGSLPNRSLQVDLRGLRAPYATRKHFIVLKPDAKSTVDDPSEAEAGIDLSSLDQIVEIGQARTIAKLLQGIAQRTADGAVPVVSLMKSEADAIGIEHCLPTTLEHGDLVGVRRTEVVAALSRLRGLNVS